ncbi:NUDIX hydrolase [Phycisphaera mikurensis]|uniref:Putative mutator MutT protein n=1 Tax=Phycisphaera mikurensis (strain NBRC 102666 / KCTC 22515 / FYK2301M01) TaxID=1142394 RepID=I0IJB7_PHYMF|nr:NUDIX domain-containing protein [Phycisphaera mikurensis]MBB6441846.1 8-oxo-dGTP diphosphatase [Phycisphaera mikurensis]BAM05355.1 putative mutator MutT protein [Phycisphaera mikurensis NBRC 102666]
MTPPAPPASPRPGPPAAPTRYVVATLCFLFDAEGRVLLLERSRPPNRNLHSPIGGKLETAIGESPAACAAREIHEEAGVTVDAADLHLAGVVSESDFPGVGHLLMFLYEVTRPVAVPPGAIDEGRLAWHAPEDLPGLAVPQTDREVIWPLFLANRGGFFAAHIDLAGGRLRWRLEAGLPAAGGTPEPGD